MKNGLVVLDEKSIRDKIYVIRGREVMIDSEISATK